MTKNYAKAQATTILKRLAAQILILMMVRNLLK